MSRPTHPSRMMPHGEQEKTILALALELGGSALCEWYSGETVQDWADAGKAILGLIPVDKASDMAAFAAFIHPEDRGAWQKKRQQAQAYIMEYRLVPESGQPVWVRESGKLLTAANGKPPRMVGLLTLMDKKSYPVSGGALPAAPRHNLKSGAGASHYPAGLLERMDALIQESADAQTEGVFMIVSIDNLSMVINAHGHERAEHTMEGVRENIAKVLPKDAVIERFYIDQFGIIIPRCDRKTTDEYAKRINSVVQHYGREEKSGALHMLSSIGSVNFPKHAHSTSDAIDKAYIALSNINGHAHYAYEINEAHKADSRSQMETANYLKHALETNRLRLAYQPIVESFSGEVKHYECLLRMADKDGRITSAGVLVPVAERMGLIDLIDEMVMNMVAEDLENAPDISLAFNLSNLTTGNREWLKKFTSLLRHKPEIASKMIVEITETAAHRDLRETAYFVASVQALGAKVALDDFGSGYTSFRQLKTLSVDMIKIDGAFVRDIVDNADNRFFVKTFLEFVNGFGLEAVAECVETGEVAKVLMDLGVHYMQGYYFSKPLNYRPWRNEGEYKAD